MFGPTLYKLGEIPYIQVVLDSLLVAQKTCLDEASSPNVKDTMFFKWSNYSKWIYYWYVIL